jgi:tRNA dimethylallyltransferase
MISPYHVPQKEKVFPPEKKKKVIVISGPTAAGKTQISLKIAEIIGGEIISADSMQVYRGMDIGTAKVSEEEQKNIPHHLLNIRNVNEPFQVVEFYHQARKAVKEIALKDQTPLVVGGSGFYLHTFLYGPPLGPPAVHAIREKLEKQMNEMGVEVLYERLQILDPIYAATITEHDRHKIIRALEIIALTEKPVSSLSVSQKIQEEDYDFRCWFLYRPRAELYQRVEKRCEEMVNMGLIEEVKILQKLGLEQNPSASQAIGYKQVLDFLKTSQNPEDFTAFLTEFKKVSRHYVKKQFTWFKKEPLFRWLDLSEIGEERAIEYILQDFEQG